MRSLFLSLAFALWPLACVTAADFPESAFRCDSKEDCPAGYWCHAKRLVTGGSEEGNVCVPQGDHYCRGSRCPSGQRCSSGDPSDTSFCVQCLVPCEPYRSNSEPPGEQGCGSCSPGQACVAGTCARGCAGPGPGCSACRFLLTSSPPPATSGGACSGSGGAVDCASATCAGGTVCAAFFDGDGGAALHCVPAAANGACNLAAGCSSGICVDGQCREACSLARPSCPSCEPLGLSGAGFCR